MIIMENGLFRDKSIKRVSSPEQLNDYIRVSNPGVWICMAAVLVLLAGICIWGIFGQLDTTVSAALIVKDGTMVCHIKEADIQNIRSGMTVTAGGREFIIETVSDAPIAVPSDADSYLLHVGGLTPGEWVYEATAQVTLEDGIYDGSILVERVSPLSFVFN